MQTLKLSMPAALVLAALIAAVVVMLVLVRDQVGVKEGLAAVVVVVLAFVASHLDPLLSLVVPKAPAPPAEQ